MTTNSVKDEAERIMAKTGRYIPPYKLAAMTSAASKVLKLITSEGVAMSYEDCNFVLEIVRQSIALATGKETV